MSVPVQHPMYIDGQFVMQQNVHNQNGKRCLLLNAPVGCAKSPPGSANAPVKSVR